VPEPLWQHQEQALDFALAKFREYHAAMLAICMGGGKSRVAIELAQRIAARLILILCPLRVVEVWRTQFTRFSTTEYQFAALDDRYASVPEKAAEAQQLLIWSRERQKRLVIAVNYDSARRMPFASWALRQAWPLVIADEVHRIKSGRGATSKWVAQLGLHAFRRLGLTGTPMPHQPTDIWAQFRFLNPHVLDPAFSAFRDRYAVMGGYFDKQIVGWKNREELQQRFRQLAFQVDDSVLDLPPEMDETLSANLGDEGRRIYCEMEEEMIAWIGAQAQITAANAMVKLLRLQQITGGSLPDDLHVEHAIDTAKEDLLADFLGDIGREPIVVFAVFRSDLRTIHRAALKHGLASGELSGDLKRRGDLARWQRGGPDDPPVLAVQIQAGEVGIDLTRARIGVYYSLGFSLANYLQSRARIRRPPQQRPCVFYHLQIRNSIDQYVLHAVRARRDLVDSVLKDLQEKGASREPYASRSAS
jgi:SNF2 family DNA or RNA helicase